MLHDCPSSISYNRRAIQIKSKNLEGFKTENFGYRMVRIEIDNLQKKIDAVEILQKNVFRSSQHILL